MSSRYSGIDWERNNTAKRVLDFAKSRESFTVKDVQKALRLKVGTARYYVDALYAFLRTERTNHDAPLGQSFEYAYVGLRELPEPHKWSKAQPDIEDLYGLAHDYATGVRFEQSTLDSQFADLDRAYEIAKSDLVSLQAVCENPDFRNKESLVNRIVYNR